MSYKSMTCRIGMETLVKWYYTSVTGTLVDIQRNLFIKVNST